jgi:hypothetical protein
MSESFLRWPWWVGNFGIICTDHATFFFLKIRRTLNFSRLVRYSLRSKVMLPCNNFLKGDFFRFFLFYVRYSTLLHQPPLRFHCVGRMLGWNPGMLGSNPGDAGIDPRTMLESNPRRCQDRTQEDAGIESRKMLRSNTGDAGIEPRGRWDRTQGMLGILGSSFATIILRLLSVQCTVHSAMNLSIA